MGSLSLVEDLTMKKYVDLPCPNWWKGGGAFLISRGKVKPVSMEFEDRGVEGWVPR